MKTPHKEAGFTLIELMMVVALMPLLFMSMYYVLTMANVIFQTNDVYARVNQSGLQSLRNVNREIGQTSPNLTPNHLNITNDGNNNSIVRFQIPVDWDNDGDVITAAANPAVEWGAYDQAGQLTNGRLGGWIRYSVNNSNQLIRDVLDAGLVQVAGTSKVIANNVQAFTAIQAQNAVTTTLNLRATDTIGQRGATRNVQQIFTSSTILRNAVN